MSDLIRKEDAIKAISRRIKPTPVTLTESAWNRATRKSIELLSEIPSAEPKKGTLTEEAREALMRLTMCAREECKVCKYENDCGFDTQYQRATENMIIISNALSEPKTGEWIEAEVLPEVYDIEGVKTWGSKMQCDQCGFRFTAIEGHIMQYNFCPSCGADMRGEK